MIEQSRYYELSKSTICALGMQGAGGDFASLLCFTFVIVDGRFVYA
jgi:hypothetical protein